MNTPSLEECLAACRDPEQLARQINRSQDLAKIATKLSRWREVRPWLDLSESDEDAVLHDFQSTERRRLGLLEKWRERHGAKATYKALARAFHSAGRLDLVDEVCEVLNTSSEDVTQGEQFHMQSNLPATPSVDIDQGEQVGTQGSQSVLWKRLVVSVVVVLIVLAALYLMQPQISILLSRMLYYFNLRMYSKSLPYPTEHFVSREKEMDDIYQLIGCDNGDVQVVSIVGPPGIGKTTTAIRVGHMMVERGVSVYYVDMIEVSSTQALAEKVLASDDTLVSTKNVTVKRLMKWAGDLQYCTVLILDNCDDTLREQENSLRRVVKKLLQSSGHLKVLMTSRQRITQIGRLETFELPELPVDASCNLLRTIAHDTTIALPLCEEIANLTGYNPLALQVVGTLLSQATSPDYEPLSILAQLREQRIDTLSPEEFLPEERVNVSIDLSYRHLDHELKEIGRYLANFPGSFDQDAACTILQYIYNNTFTHDFVSRAVEQLVRRSLLEFNRRKGRFHFHTLIRHFFLDISRLTAPNDDQIFSAHFQLYYSKRLEYLNTLYDSDYVQALAELDLERHNIKHLLSEATTRHVSFDHEEYLPIVSAIVISIRSRYLSSRFAAKELHRPLKKIANELSQTLSMSEADYRLKSNVTLIIFYVNGIVFADVEVVNLEEQMGIPKAQSIQLLLAHREVLERKTIKTVAAKPAFSAYSWMYQQFADYYRETGDLERMKECHVKILTVKEVLNDIEPSQCTFVDIGSAYYFTRRYKEGAYFLELARQDLPNFDIPSQLCLLNRLRDANVQLDDITKAESIFMEMLDLFHSLINTPSSMLSRNTVLLQTLISVYREHNRTEEANALAERQVQAIREVGAKTSVAKEVKELIEYIFKEGNYSKVADLAQFGRDSMKHLPVPPSQQMESTGLRLDLEIFIGRAKYHAGNYSEGLGYLALVTDDLYKLGPSTYPKQFNAVCSYVLIRLRFGCVRNETINQLWYLGAGAMNMLFGLLLDSPVQVYIYNDTPIFSPSHAQVGQTSSKTSVVGVEDTLAVSRAFWMFSHYIKPRSWFESWIHAIHTGLQSWFVFVSRPVVWALNYEVVRFIVNVVWVYTKLMFVVYSYKWIRYFVTYIDYWRAYTIMLLEHQPHIVIPRIQVLCCFIFVLCNKTLSQYV